MLAEFELTIYFHISFTSENEQRVATIKKIDLIWMRYLLPHSFQF